MRNAIPKMIDNSVRTQVNEIVLRMLESSLTQPTLDQALQHHPAGKRYMESQTITIHPKPTHQIPYSQLKQSLFDAWLKDPKLREQDKHVLEVLSKGADVQKLGKDTCRMDDLCKRSHGDLDYDYHEGEIANKQKTVGISSSAIKHTPTQTSQQNLTKDASKQTKDVEQENNLLDMDWSREKIHEVSRNQKLSWAEVARIKNDTHNFLKNSFTSNIEYEYHVSQVKLAMSDMLYWINPESHLPKEVYIPNDNTASKGFLQVQDALSHRRIKVTGEDSNAYVFFEANFNKLRIDDIEDLYLMKIQRKLEYLTVNIMEALLVFIRSAVIRLTVEDLQLGLESCQKRLNIRRTKLTFLSIEEVGPYTLVQNSIEGMVFLNINQCKRLMGINWCDRLCDTTLLKVKEVLRDMLNDHKMGYKIG
ncbi:hypothetical protein Tco_0237958 [Tanacetum coccineum]